MSTPKPAQSSKKLLAVFDRSMLEFDRVQCAVRNERIQCLKDRRFYSVTGAQWEGNLGEQFANKPRFEMNKIHLAVIRVVNEYRNNRISVDFIPKDGRNDDQTADACDDLYRADEQDCGGQEAFDNGFEEGTAGGMGAWRVRGCYEDEYDDDNTQQRIRIEPIYDADSCVFFDLGAKRQDKADAKRCWVLSGMTVDAFIEEYGDDPVTWPHDITQQYFDWVVDNTVYVAEYYEIEEKSQMVYTFRGLALNADEPNEKKVTEQELEDDPELMDTLIATGFQIIREKRVKYRAIHKYLMSGGGILEDCGVIAGKNIPIVPFYGKRWYVDGIERCMGHVRLAKDAQMLKNMLTSMLADIASRFDVEKPIVTPEQIAGHVHMWANDNIEKFPYLLLNPVTDGNGNNQPAGPMAYTKAPNLPPALAALMQSVEQDLQDLLGNQQAGEEMKPNMSGKAVELIQNRLDMQVFIYMDNMSKAVKRTGEIWLSMASDLYVEDGRKMKTMTAGGDTGSIELNRPMYDEESGKTNIENNLTKANFDVAVDVGPSSVSRRAATVRALTGMMQLTQNPEDLQVLTSMAMMNMEGEGISDVRDYYRGKLLRMGAVKPTEEEAQQLAKEKEAAAQQVDPNAELLKAAAAEATAKANKAEADMQKSLADAAHLKADTIKILSEIETSREAHALQLAQGLASIDQAQQALNLQQQQAAAAAAQQAQQAEQTVTQ